jgi:hypothetical protein
VGDDYATEFHKQWAIGTGVASAAARQKQGDQTRKAKGNLEAEEAKGNLEAEALAAAVIREFPAKSIAGAITKPIKENGVTVDRMKRLRRLLESKKNFKHGFKNDRYRHL